MHTKPLAPCQALPFFFWPLKSLSRQPGCTLLSRTINWDNKFNRTSELHDVREKKSWERTFRRLAIDFSKLEGTPGLPKQRQKK